MKRSLLIVYSKMIVGGSTTSLLSLLHELDYGQYDVDLLLYEKGGVLDGQIPPAVNVLDNAFLHAQKRPLSYKAAFAGAYLKSKLRRNPLIRSQIMSKQLVKSQPVLSKSYDTAIAYLEFWPSNYVHQKVNAKQKILWLHVDYLEARLDMRCDKRMYGEANAIVTVSEECKKNLINILPGNDNIYCIHNILSSKTIHGLSTEFVPNEKLYEADTVFITVARIVFNHKGYDRGVNAFQKMKKAHPEKSFKWLIIGDGPDRPQLEVMIENAGLQDAIILLGELTNPHPYVKKADIFFLPSRYEGKPMSVTEAQMNGVVPFVTNYASASGQIRHMEDGLVCENNDEALVTMMDRIFSGEIDLDAMKKRIAQTDYSNREEVEKVYKLLK